MRKYRELAEELGFIPPSDNRRLATSATPPGHATSSHFNGAAALLAEAHT
jgi:hypothetical protein